MRTFSKNSIVITEGDSSSSLYVILSGEVKVFVDTAPVMEKPLAQAAGLGWQGKHTNLLGRDLGSWFFLGAIFTTLELPADVKTVKRAIDSELQRRGLDG